ncbi:hypothetical protein [Pseudomonas putida]|jgi:hypothetical protein|uniref:hypothetical protein n=1 Tax=Pseudomonas putida TaxID=303 RepID=UPI000CD491A6|nr:hypothetical protein [Pseudomonas putida]POG00115.1 hypothetical protein BGP83_23565 [Pseudomonas putida]
MTPLALRLKSLAKRVASLEQDPTAYAALAQLESALDALDNLLPARPRGRPKHRDLAMHLLRFYVDGMKTLPDSGVATDKDALLLYLRKHKGRSNLKTLQNRLARARKLTR